MSGQPMLISPGQVSVADEPAATSVWVERAGHYAAQAVANAERAHERTIAKRLDKPSRAWTAGEVVRSYRANADGERRYREEADALTLHGYQGWLETGRAGDPLGARILLAPTLGVSGGQDGGRSSRSRTVTWTKVSAP
jgi:hypothetical protein